MTQISSITTYPSAVSLSEVVNHVSDRVHHIVETLRRFVWRVTGLQRTEDLKAAAAFSRQLADLERIPIYYNTASGKCNSAKDYKDSIQLSKEFLKRIKQYANSKDAKGSKCYFRIKRQMLGLKYRLGSVNGGLDALDEGRDHIIKELTDLSSAFKKKQWQLKDRTLSKQNQAAIKTVAKHPAFAKLIMEDKALRGAFLKWAIRDNCPVEPFILFPDICGRLTQCFINKRIGLFNGILQRRHVETEEGYSEYLTLKFEGKDVSIMDEEKTVTLKHGYTVKIKEVFKGFKNKNYDPSNFEVFEDGIHNFNAMALGAWNPKKKAHEVLNLDKKEWWKTLPTFQIMTPAEVKARYDRSIKPGERAVVAMGSRETPDLNVINTHGWMEIVEPTDDGRFRIYPLGKVADHFPKNTWETLKIIADTRPARFFYPDENVFFSHRQVAGIMFKLSDEKFNKMMGVIKSDIQRSREGRIVFQFLSDNCACWVQKVIEKTLGKKNTPRIYKQQIDRMELTGFLNVLALPIRLIKNAFLNGLYVGLLFRTLGAWRTYSVGKGLNKRTWSVTRSEFWGKRICYLPASMVARRVLTAKAA